MDITKEYIFHFGKYKKERLVDVMLFDAQYIMWCYHVIKWFELDDECYDLVSLYADKQPRKEITGKVYYGEW